MSKDQLIALLMAVIAMHEFALAIHAAECPILVVAHASLAGACLAVALLWLTKEATRK